jgi:hypothetical protein
MAIFNEQSLMQKLRAHTHAQTESLKFSFMLNLYLPLAISGILCIVVTTTGLNYCHCVITIGVCEYVAAASCIISKKRARLARCAPLAAWDVAPSTQ